MPNYSKCFKGAISMNIYYLMVKTHNITGLKYLCQTRKKDPYRYLGSGIEWATHLRKFGKTVTTEVIFQTTDKQQLNDLGRYYSQLWRVVDAMDDFGNKIWANLIPETGGGPGVANPTPEINYKRSLKLLGRTFPHMKESPSDETCLKMSLAQKGIPKGPMSEEQKLVRKIKQTGVLKGPQVLITCHCGKTGGTSNMKRYHFNNCKIR
jgi:hypothetical protein